MRSVQSFGFAKEEGERCLAILDAIGLDQPTALQLRLVAMDLARYAMEPLEDMAYVLALASGGHYRALPRLGFKVDSKVPPSEVLRVVAETVAGQAEAYTKTYWGSRDVWSQTHGIALRTAIRDVFARFRRT